MWRELVDAMEALGDKAAMVPFERLDDIRRDMDALKRNAFHTEAIDWLIRSVEEFDPGAFDFVPCSLLVIASPSPVCTLRFERAGGVIETLLPPAYIDHKTKGASLLLFTRQWLAPYGYDAASAVALPHKLLAVHTGLGRYGRNNICYVDGFGSYMGLCVLCTDMPCDNDVWFPVRRLDRCDRCQACVGACPTEAIDAGREIIDAGRCLTSFNEEEGAFPEWIRSEWHRCLVGCMRCQSICSENEPYRSNVVEGPVFTEAETDAILSHREGEEWPETVLDKIRTIGIYPYRERLPRNLASLIRV